MTTSYRLRTLLVPLILMLVAISNAAQDSRKQRSDIFGGDSFIVVPPDPFFNNVMKVYGDGSRKALKEGKLSLAERIARKGLSLIPDSTRLLRLRAEALLRLGNNKEALRCYLQVSTGFYRKETTAKLGLLYHRLGMFDKSYELISQYDLRSKFTDSDRAAIPMPNTRRGLEQYWLIAAGLSTASDYGSAIYYFEQVHKKNPSSNFINMKLGDAYMREKRYKDAVEAYGRVKTGPERTVYKAWIKKLEAEKKLKSIDKSVDKAA